MGDSRIRQQYYSFIQAISDVNEQEQKVHADLQFDDPRIHLQTVQKAAYTQHLQQFGQL